MVDLRHLPEHLQGQVRYFAHSSRSYGTPRATEPWQRKYQERLFRHIRNIKSKVFVDDACGSGYMGIEAAKRGAIVLACDLNLEGLVRLAHQARRLGFSQKLFVICCSSEALPIRSSAADAVVANAILEHLPNEDAAVSEISRITKPNAVTMITVPLAYYLLNPLFLLLNMIHDKRIGHLRRYTREMLVSRFSGWKVLAVYYSGHTRKVIKTIINTIARIFDEEDMEDEDEKYAGTKLFASNISAVFKKKVN